MDGKFHITLKLLEAKLQNMHMQIMRRCQQIMTFPNEPKINTTPVSVVDRGSQNRLYKFIRSFFGLNKKGRGNE